MIEAVLATPFDDLAGYAMTGVMAGDHGIEIRTRAGGIAKPLFAGTNVLLRVAVTEVTKDDLPGLRLSADTGSEAAARTVMQGIDGRARPRSRWTGRVPRWS